MRLPPALRLFARLLLLVPVALGTACTQSELAEAPGDDPWALVAEVDYAGEGGDLLTPDIVVSEGGAGFALFVETDGCAHVAHLSDTETTWVSDEGAGGPEARFSPIAGSGMLVHLPERATDGDATIRLRQLSCETMTRLSAAEDPGRMRLWMRPLPGPIDGPVHLPVTLHHGPFSVFSDAAGLTVAVDDLLRPAGLALDVVSTEADALPPRIAWSEGVPDELDALVDPRDAHAHIFFAGCLEKIHPATGRRDVLDGLVPRVPGLGAAGGGVFLRGRECGAGETPAIRWTEDVMAHRIAHELGHFLGLFHTVEADGEEDDLSDTDQGTLMALRPSDAPFFSPDQAARMRLYARLLEAPTPR